jgi:hypothetical protein
MGSKMIVLFLGLGFSLSASAGSVHKVTGTNSTYPGSGVSTYLKMATADITERAAKVCAESGGEVARIGQIKIQMKADFAPEGSRKSLRAVTYPEILFSALVECK